MKNTAHLKAIMEVYGKTITGLGPLHDISLPTGRPNSIYCHGVFLIMPSTEIALTSAVDGSFSQGLEIADFLINYD